jgi:hypothetical protein
MGDAEEGETVTKIEAEVMRAAFRFWRASNGMNPDSPEDRTVRPDQVAKAKASLLETVGRAAAMVKDWVEVVQSANANVGFISCQGCRDSQRVEGPFTMEKFTGVYQQFRAKHIECGPVGEDPVADAGAK